MLAPSALLYKTVENPVVVPEAPRENHAGSRKGGRCFLGSQEKILFEQSRYIFIPKCDRTMNWHKHIKKKEVIIENIKRSYLGSKQYINTLINSV